MVAHLLQVDGINGIFIAFFTPKSPCGLLGCNGWQMRQKGKEIRVAFRLDGEFYDANVKLNLNGGDAFKFFTIISKKKVIKVKKHRRRFFILPQIEVKFVNFTIYHI